MFINQLNIKNYKSLYDVTLEFPNKFSVFVGANSTGKSNVFEALDFANKAILLKEKAISIFGGASEIASYNTTEPFEFLLKTDEKNNILFNSSLVKDVKLNLKVNNENSDYFHPFIENFSRIFIKKTSADNIKIEDDSKLSLDAHNLEKVLSRLLNDDSTREEIFDWLHLLLPEFKEIKVDVSPLSGKEELLLFENAYSKPFSGKLISDGTWNILSLLSAVYQNKNPQFICIEEPENGLNPKVIKELVNLFRNMCNEYGHHIWLTTHSQSLVSELNQEEIIVVNKVNGKTFLKQVNDMNLHGLKTDEAWLSNVFDGGVPW